MPVYLYGAARQENNQHCLKHPQNNLKLPSAVTSTGRQTVCVAVHPYHLSRGAFEAASRLSGHTGSPTLSNSLGFSDVL